MKPVLGLAVASAIAVTAPSASGAKSPIELTWDAPASCPSRAHVEAEVERVLGKDVAGPPIVAHATVRLEGDWMVTLTLVREGETGERVLRAPTCLVLANATALALALTASTTMPQAAPPPLAAPPPASPEPADPAPPSVAPEVAPPPETPGRAGADALPLPATSSSARKLVVGGMLAFDSSVLPHAAVGPTVFVAWRPSRLELELGATYLAGQHAGLSDRGGATLSLAAASARLCYAFAMGIALSPCASMELGAVLAGSSGPQTTSATAPWIAPGVFLRARYPREGSFAAIADVGTVVALERPQFVVDGVLNVYQTAPLTVRGGLGLEARFP